MNENKRENLPRAGDFGFEVLQADEDRGYVIIRDGGDEFKGFRDNDGRFTLQGPTERLTGPKMKAMRGQMEKILDRLQKARQK